jgi:Zn-dependent peptidase ImmA (M78 family)
VTQRSSSRLADCLQSGDYGGIAQALVELERARGAVSIDDLSNDPFRVLETQRDVAVEYTEALPDDCSVFGYYRPSPATIYVHQSVSLERDNFTILHEFGHHVQRQHLEWADLWLALPDREGMLVNETVADSFAAEVLVPAHSVPFGLGPLRAKSIRDGHTSSRASRQALVMRAVELCPEDEHSVIAITDLDGRVTFSRTTCEEPPPRRGAVQPGIKSLIRGAQQENGWARGRLDGGIVAASGWTRQDMVAEVAIDVTGRYAFVVIQPESRYAPQRWDRLTHECLNPACEAVFDYDESVATCNRCGQPKCPECGVCACERPAARRCPDCHIELSAAEMSGAIEHECW